MFTESATPLADGVLTNTQGPADRSVGPAVSGGQHDPSAHHVAMLTTYSSSPGPQQPALPITENYLIRTRHRHPSFVAERGSVLTTTRRAFTRIMDAVPTPPESTKTSLRQRLQARANDRWPQLTDLTIRHHGQFAYVAGQLPDGTTLPLFRLRYGGSANNWGFAIHLASHNSYQDSVLPSGYPVGTPEDALDCACGLYLNDPTPESLHDPRRTNGRDH